MWCFEKAIFAYLKFNICIPKLGNLHTMSIFRHTLIFWVWASLDTQQPCIYTFAWSALHLPQAYHLNPSSPFHKPESFILTNFQVLKVHIVWHFNLKFYHRENAVIVKVNVVNFRILSRHRKYCIKICLNVPCCNTCTDPNRLLCKIDAPFTNSL